MKMGVPIFRSNIHSQIRSINMKKKTKVILIVLLVIVLAAAVAAYLNRDLFAIVKDSVSYDNETLEKMVEENQVKTDETLKSIGIESVNPLTEEDLEKLQSGEMTEEEAAEKVVGISGSGSAKPDGSGEQTNSENSKPGQPENGTDGGKKQETDQNVARLVGKMYVLKAKFESELSGLESWVISQYVALPESERTYSAKVKLGRQALDKANSLEANCDSQVNAILNDMETELKNAGMDTSSVDSIRSAYENEKKITKSYYLSKYL